MAKIIDSFLVSIGLDTTQYKKGQKEAEESLRKFGKATEENAKNINIQSAKVAEGFSAIKRELVGIAGMAVGAAGLKDLFFNLMKGQAALSRSAYNLGMSARELDAWGAAAETVGGDAKAMQQSIQSMQQGFFEASVGMNQQVVTGFMAAGVKITDVNGKVKDTKTLFLELADALKKRTPQEQLGIARLIGIDEGTLNLLRQGRVGVEDLYNQMYRLSGTTAESAEEAKKAQKEWALFSRTLIGFAQTAFPAVSQAIRGIVGEIKDLTRTMLDFAVKALDSPLGKKIIGFMGQAGSTEAGIVEDQSQAALAYNAARKAANAGAPESSASSAPVAPQGSKLPRGIRNNNPGNIEYGAFAKSMGATGSDGRFAIFPSMEAGQKAMQSLLSGRGYVGGSNDTIAKVIAKYAPSSENNTQAYIASVAKRLGIDPNQKLTSANIPALSNAMALHEVGANYAPYLNTGGGGMQARGNSTITTTINTMNIQTQARDADGLAKGIYGALQQNNTLAGSTTGMN